MAARWAGPGHLRRLRRIFTVFKQFLDLDNQLFGLAQTHGFILLKLYERSIASIQEKDNGAPFKLIPFRIPTPFGLLFFQVKTFQARSFLIVCFVVFFRCRRVVAALRRLSYALAKLILITQS